MTQYLSQKVVYIHHNHAVVTSVQNLTYFLTLNLY